MKTQQDNLNDIATLSDSQCRLLAQHMLTGRKITQPIAMRKLGIGHLPRRILDLKEFYGLPIKGRYTTYIREFDGKKTRIKEYYIDPADLTTLIMSFKVEEKFKKVGNFLVNKQRKQTV